MLLHFRYLSTARLLPFCRSLPLPPPFLEVLPPPPVRFHFAPFASDFTELSTLPLKFRRGEPFKPFEQLMAVLPARSAHCLPVAHQKRMVETKSEIAVRHPELKLNMPA